MPNHVKSKGINLIKNEIEERENFKYKRDWYLLLNVLIISLLIAFSVVAVLLKANIESNIANRKAQLAAKINENYNPATRQAIRNRINSFQDKYEIYKDFQNQNFDFNVFYSDVLKIYPQVRVSKFVVQPDSNAVDLILVLDKKGYNELPKFLTAIERNDRFKNSIVKSVTFSLDQSDVSAGKSLMSEVKNTDIYKMEVSLTVEKQVKKKS